VWQRPVFCFWFSLMQDGMSQGAALMILVRLKCRAAVWTKRDKWSVHRDDMHGVEVDCAEACHDSLDPSLHAIPC